MQIVSKHKAKTKQNKILNNNFASILMWLNSGAKTHFVSVLPGFLVSISSMPIAIFLSGWQQLNSPCLPSFNSSASFSGVTLSYMAIWLINKAYGSAMLALPLFLHHLCHNCHCCHHPCHSHLLQSHGKSVLSGMGG